MDDKTPEKKDDGDDKKKGVSDKDKFDKDGNLYIKLTIEDSALVVRSDGNIEMISHELEQAEGGHVGDIEDLNKTFSLVLALASALENEDLYNRIFHNLNMTLMARWQDIPENIKADIIHNRRNEALNRTPEEREDKNKRVDEFRNRMNKYKNSFLSEDEEKRKLKEDIEREAEFLDDVSGDFIDPSEVQKHMEQMDDIIRRKMGEQSQENLRQRRKVKRNPLAKLRNVNWDAYDKSLTAHFKDFRADAPPDDEE
tara:strand:+ start:119 stop:883 length:765 start_codon:yes stop_codon:yes gene_type:complete